MYDLLGTQKGLTFLLQGHWPHLQPLFYKNVTNPWKMNRHLNTVFTLIKKAISITYTNWEYPKINTPLPLVNWKRTGNHLTNIKCLSKESGHHEPPEQLHCTLAQILQVCKTVLDG